MSAFGGETFVSDRVASGQRGWGDIGFDWIGDRQLLAESRRSAQSVSGAPEGPLSGGGECELGSQCAGQTNPASASDARRRLPA